MELEILDMMNSQQETIQKSEEKDERVFEALLKSQADAQRQHQEFDVSILGKLGDIFASKKWVSTQRFYSKEKKNRFYDCCKISKINFIWSWIAFWTLKYTMLYKMFTTTDVRVV